MITIKINGDSEHDWNVFGPQLTEHLRNCDDFTVIVPNKSRFRTKIRSRASYWQEKLGCKIKVHSLRTRGGGYNIWKDYSND